MKTPIEIARECLRESNFVDDDYDEEHRERAILKVTAAITAEREERERLQQRLDAIEEFSAGHPAICCGQCIGRLKELEAERDRLKAEKVRYVYEGSDCEAELLNKQTQEIETLRKERDEAIDRAYRWSKLADLTPEEVAALQARVAELEKYEPSFGTWLCGKCRRAAPSGKDCYSCLEAHVSEQGKIIKAVVMREFGKDNRIDQLEAALRELLADVKDALLRAAKGNVAALGLKTPSILKAEAALEPKEEGK